jgi:hypothetical protein
MLRSTSEAVIQARVDKIDIPEWLFVMTDEEHQQCSIPHFAGVATWTPAGKRVPINVEDITEKHHCLLVSMSDMVALQERTKVRCMRETTVKPRLRGVRNAQKLSLCSRLMTTWYSSKRAGLLL